MNDDQFAKLFKHIDARFDAVDKRFDDVHGDIENLRGTVVDFAEHLDTYAQEMAAMDHKIDRLERYIQVIAQKTGVDLDTIHI